jgi:hypothetical protein
MNELLKKELEKLSATYPELANSKVVFSGSDVSFDSATDDKENKVASCNFKAEFPLIIRGHSPKIEVRKSPIHGYGVFAKESLEEGELIEECKLLRYGWRSHYLNDPVMKDYVWANKGCGCIECRNHGTYNYVALGFGSLYNHNDAPNTKQKLDFASETMVVKARKRIEKDEELLVNYGDKYFLVRNFWKSLNENKKFEQAMLSKKLRDEASKQV